MAKIVYASLKASRSTAGKSKSVRKDASKAVIGPDGKKLLVLVVDANSSTFGEDLRQVFGKNVAEARRANRRVLKEKAGAPSIA